MRKRQVGESVPLHRHNLQKLRLSYLLLHALSFCTRYPFSNSTRLTELLRTDTQEEQQELESALQQGGYTLYQDSQRIAGQRINRKPRGRMVVDKNKKAPEPDDKKTAEPDPDNKATKPGPGKTAEPKEGGHEVINVVREMEGGFPQPKGASTAAKTWPLTASLRTLTREPRQTTIRDRLMSESRQRRSGRR
jgi:hypothetical protein